MIQVTEQTYKDLVAGVISAAQPEKIYLFGSRGRGEAAADADIDLLVVVAEPFSEERTRYQLTLRIRHALSGVKHPKDILVFTVEEMLKWRLSPNHIVYKCLAEGRVLYAR